MFTNYVSPNSPFCLTVPFRPTHGSTAARERAQTGLAKRRARGRVYRPSTVKLEHSPKLKLTGPLEITLPPHPKPISLFQFSRMLAAPSSLSSAPFRLTHRAQKLRASLCVCVNALAYSRDPAKLAGDEVLTSYSTKFESRHSLHWPLNVAANVLLSLHKKKTRKSKLQRDCCTSAESKKNIK